MIKAEKQEAIRRPYFIEAKSIRAFAREFHCGRRVVRRAIGCAEAARYTLRQPREAPVLGPYKALIDQLPAERLPRKQLYTARKIYETIKAEGYTGSEPGVRNYIARRREQQGPKVSVPLELDPGTDGQVAWSEGVAIIAGEQVTVQLFLMRSCYSRRLFMMAFPAQKQEAFTSTSSVRASKGTCGRSITFRGCRTASAMIT